MAIRIGVNPIGWSNDDLPELGGETPLEVCLSEARQAGYEGVELGNKFPREAATLRPILAAHGLELVSGWYSTFLLGREAEAEMEAARAHRTLLKAMGCKVLIAAECTGTVHADRTAPLALRPVMSEAEWGRFAPRLSRFAELLAADGLTLVYHHHMGTVIQTGPEIDWMMRETTPAVRLLLDTGHATWAGADPARLARDWRARIGHVHTKDVRPAVAAEAGRRNWSFLDAVIAGVYTVPGDGAIDFAAVLRELPGYAGWIVVEAEQDPKKADPLTYARKGREHLARVLASLRA
jgi:inosose dehydratase/3D-(3,5/4)-trihydroxycyclohexane-1,2-dione acylhydrolase (decyclizing)